MRMKLFNRAHRSSKTAKRTTIAMATVVSSLGIGLLGAAPAQASTPFFYIYYSPDCTNAFRDYTGANSGERWINDRFDQGYGEPGYNQLIAYNAASVWVPSGTWLDINFDSNQAFQIGYSHPGQCYNLPSAIRNYNYDWADGSL